MVSTQSALNNYVDLYDYLERFRAAFHVQETSGPYIRIQVSEIQWLPWSHSLSQAPRANLPASIPWQTNICYKCYTQRCKHMHAQSTVSVLYPSALICSRFWDQCQRTVLMSSCCHFISPVSASRIPGGHWDSVKSLSLYIHWTVPVNMHDWVSCIDVYSSNICGWPRNRSFKTTSNLGLWTTSEMRASKVTFFEPSLTLMLGSAAIYWLSADNHVLKLEPVLG